MITITFYGLDQFVVGRLSRELTPYIAKLYEVDEDEVNFFAPQLMVFHKGTEQTSWNILIRVNAPKNTALVQEKMSELLLNGIGEVAIHIAVEFYYYDSAVRYTKINDAYPRYISEENIVGMDEEYPEDLEEGEEADQIYTGDIFKDFDK